jgi:transcriptional regulator with XRE-family HTH domain
MGICQEICAKEARVEIPAVVRQIRKRLGETQTEFAWVLGVAQNTVSQYETGQIAPGLKALSALYEYAEGNNEKAVLVEATRRELLPRPGEQDPALIVERLKKLARPSLNTAQRAALRYPPQLAGFLVLTTKILDGEIVLDESIMEILHLWADHAGNRKVSRHFRDAAAFLRVQLQSAAAVSQRLGKAKHRDKQG